MKSLNDNLREEFGEILEKKEIAELIVDRNLDNEIIKKAFEKLLENKYGGDDPTAIEKGRSEFETYIINSLKTKKHNDDN
jgi:hypothetical protein